MEQSYLKIKEIQVKVNYYEFYDDFGQILVEYADYVKTVEEFAVLYFSKMGYEVFRDSDHMNHSGTYFSIALAACGIYHNLPNKEIENIGIKIDNFKNFAWNQITPNIFRLEYKDSKDIIDTLKKHYELFLKIPPLSPKCGSLYRENGCVHPVDNSVFANSCSDRNLVSLGCASCSEKFRKYYIYKLPDYIKISQAINPATLEVMSYLLEENLDKEHGYLIRQGWPDLLVWKGDFSDRFWCEVKSKNDKLNKIQLDWVDINNKLFNIKYIILRVLPENTITPRKEIIDFLASLNLERFGKRVSGYIFDAVPRFWYTSRSMLKDGEFGIRLYLGEKSANCLLEAIREKRLLQDEGGSLMEKTKNQGVQD